MMRITIVLAISILIALGHGRAHAQNWGSWQRWEKPADWRQGEKQEKKDAAGKKHPGKSKKYCSTEQEKELLDLLQQLQDPAFSNKDVVGGTSEVRRKYRIARRLRKFDDCRAEDALRKLSEEDLCEDLGEGDLLCVKWSAEASLQEIDATADMKKLVPETPLDEQEKIIKKYTKRPYKNDFAVQEIKKYVLEQSETNPEFFVPLMVECFPLEPRTEVLLRKYPQLVDKCLNICFDKKGPPHVWSGINMARHLGKSNFLKRVHGVAFKQKGNLDYSNTAEIEAIQTMAIGFYRDFEQQSVPYYRDVLYGDFTQGREYVISGVRDMTNPELLVLFKEYAASLQAAPRPEDELLLQRLQKKIALMEEAQK